MPNAVRELLPGLALAACVAVGASLLASLLPLGGGVIPALVLGILIGNIWRLPEGMEPGVHAAERSILSASIVLMGLELQVGRIAEIGWAPVGFIAVLVTVVMLVAAPLGMRLGFSKSFAVLIGAGHAICGASAVAALGPLVKARREEVGVAIGVVNLMGTVGIFVAPPLVLALGYTAAESGYLIGGVLNAVGQTVAAGFSVGRETGEIATFIKMQRILFLGPLLIGASLLFHTPVEGVRRTFPIPGFLFGFALASVVGSLLPDEALILPFLKSAGKFLLIVAMAGIGLHIRIRDLLHTGPKAVLFGGILFVLQILLAMSIIPMIDPSVD